METNLEKAKRLIRDNAAISGIELPEDGFIFKMLELAATPDIIAEKGIHIVGGPIPKKLLAEMRRTIVNGKNLK